MRSNFQAVIIGIHELRDKDCRTARSLHVGKGLGEETKPAVACSGSTRGIGAAWWCNELDKKCKKLKNQ